MKIKKLIGILSVFLCLGSCKQPAKTTLFVGTYTNNGSEGIYSYTFDTETGELKDKKLAFAMRNPSFISISSNKKFLYAVEETSAYANSKGSVVAFAIEGDRLSKINRDTVVGADPCHIGLSKDGKFLASSSYSGGSIAIFELAEDGSLQPNPQQIDHQVLDSVKTSHAHASLFTPEGLFTADLGLDAVKRYRYNTDKFIPSEQASINLPEGAGPRHFKFSKDGTFLYVLNELNSTITTFQKNIQGAYISLDTKSTLDTKYKGKNSCADIHLSKDGLFLYGSNRGENTIVIFKVDKETGKLTLVGRQAVKGEWPRNFSIDPTNKFLLVANKSSSNIAVFKRDIEKGTLDFLQEVKLPNPVCLMFLD